MRNSHGTGLAMGIGLLLSHLCFSGSGPGETDTSTLQATVRVFGYAPGSLEAWKSAQDIATRIFNRAGIEPVWMTCSLSPDGQFLVQDCAATPQPGDIILRLVPASSGTRKHFGDSTLGLAAPAEKGTPASACVFYDRVEQLAKGRGAPVAVILGHVAAHEIGHLLIGPHSDTSLGVMNGRWNRSSMGLAKDGQLSFTKAEVATIRKEARRRAM